MPKNQGYKNINSSEMKDGGCKCGCQANTKSNHPDIFAKKKKETKAVVPKLKKPKEQKLNPY